MKLKAIKVYQSVQFNRKEELFFSDGKPGMRGVQIAYDAKAGFARISINNELGKDDILIFPANIAYAVPADAETSTDLAAEPKLSKAKQA